MKSITLTEKDIARFWSKVKIGDPDECWEWQAGRNKAGYGVFGIGNETYLANRISWAIKFGDPKESLVCHKCDNPTCVNPNHFFCGTNADNTQDKMMKGRWKCGKVRRGEDHPMSKLKDEDIPVIRQLFDAGIPTHEIGRKFGVDYKAIQNIGRRIGWTHVK